MIYYGVAIRLMPLRIKIFLKGKKIMIEEAGSLESWKAFVNEVNLTSIDVPYGFSIAAITVAGVFHLREPFEESSTDGFAVGVVNGSYDLNINNQEARLYDPTGQLVRLVISLNAPGKELWARVDTRKWDGGWSEGDRLIVWRG